MTVGGTPLVHRVVRAGFQRQTGDVLVFADTLTSALQGAFGDDSGLDLDFEVNLHVRPEPHTSTLRVRGLSRQTANSLLSSFKAAHAQAFATRVQLQAGKVELVAGYRAASGVLFNHDVLNIQYDRRADEVIFTLQDGRVPWSNSFVNVSLPGGADISTVQDVIQGALQPGLTTDEDFKSAFAQALPDYQVATGNVSGKLEFGFALIGSTRRWQGCLNDALGLKQFWLNGRPVTVSANAATLDEAVVLGGPSGYGLLDSMPIDDDQLGPGWVQVQTLLIQRLVPGRQVELRNPDGTPRDGGIFRVDQVVHRGQRSGGDWTSTCVLRPSNLM